MKRLWHRVPWWLNPWGSSIALRKLVRCQLDIIDTCHISLRVMKRTVNDLKAENKAMGLTSDALRRQIAELMGAGNPEGAFASPEKGSPEFVLVGMDIGPGPVDGSYRPYRKRIMVSRDLSGTTLTQTDYADPPPRWKVAAAMSKMLVIDKPTYGEALDRMGEIWRNWERDARLAIEDAERRKPELPWSKPDADVRGDIRQAMREIEG